MLFNVVGSIQRSEYVEMGIVGTISEVHVQSVFTVSRNGASESWCVCMCVCVCVCVNLLGIDVEFFRSF